MPRKVLLIDDDRLQFHITRAHFANFQTDRYELEWADTYESGLARLLSGDFAACLLDFQLGARDGLQLMREALAAGCRTPIVFLTAESADRIDIEAMNAGALGNSKGMFAYHRNTTANYTLTVRTADGTGSGWAAGDHPDWTQLDPKSVSDRAIEKARLSRNPIAIEPGRYTVILEPQAVGRR